MIVMDGLTNSTVLINFILVTISPLVLTLEDLDKVEKAVQSRPWQQQLDTSDRSEAVINTFQHNDK